MNAKTFFELYEPLHEELVQLSKYICENPELGHEEFKACAAHAELLKKHGFDVEVGYLGLPTAFRATYDSGKPGPTVCYLAEYDALPEIGHGCGHNILGTVSTGSGILLSKVIDEVGGRVVIGGTPAEETSGGKVTFAENGAFDDIDVVLISHPMDEDLESGTSLALEPLQFTFTGKPSHAAAAPEKGINALDACLATFHNINALREHLLSSTRIHGIVKEGGVAANIVPERAVAQFYVRTTKKAYLKEVVEKVKNCAKAGALAAGAELEITNFELGYDDLLTNTTLQERHTKNLNEVGVTNIKKAHAISGSSDVGNVSYVCPTVHNDYNIFAEGEQTFPPHTREFRDATLRPAALEAMRKNVVAQAMTGLNIILEPELLAAVKAEYELATADIR